MAISRKKKKFTIQLSLGIGGLLSIAVVSFCIFLWMFLFGVWTGQTLLEPSGEQKAGLSKLTSKFWQKKSSTEGNPVVQDFKLKSAANEREGGDGEEQEPAHFSLQVAAFRDPDKARKVVLQWRARDYTSFYLAPEQPNGTFYRVFVGVFDKMVDAKKMVASLEEKGKEKFFITLIPASEKRYP